MKVIPKFQDKGKLPVKSNKNSNRRMSERTTEKSDTTSRVSSGKTSSEVRKDREIRSSVLKPKENNLSTQINSYDMPWVVEAKQKAAAEEEAYQEDMNQPYYKTHSKPTKQQWKQQQAKRLQNQGEIRSHREVSPLVRSINNYIGEAKYRAGNGTLLLKGKYTLPAIAVASTLPVMAAAPVTTATTMGSGYVGGKVVDGVSNLLTGKNWSENMQDWTGLAPEAADATNLGVLVGGGLPLVNNSVRTATSIGDQIVRNIPVKKFVSGTPGFVKDVTVDVVKNGVKEGSKRTLETYFPSFENVVFKLPYETQEQLYPLRQYINHKIIYPRENARFSTALERMRIDPALQGKPYVEIHANHLGGFKANIGLKSLRYNNGGLRSFRAVLNPGFSKAINRKTGEVFERTINKNAIKREILTAWLKNKKRGDIITGDANVFQDPISSVSDLNLQLKPYTYTRPGLSSDSYALIHSLAKRGTGQIVFGREPMGPFNPLAEDGIIYKLQDQYRNGIISPSRYAVEAENYFRNKGINIRQPYILDTPIPTLPNGYTPAAKQQVLFSHPSYVEGLTQ